ncbi:hypothetical protein VUR80DRAFT_9331 [Thermomyces stellatus]
MVVNELGAVLPIRSFVLLANRCLSSSMSPPRHCTLRGERTTLWPAAEPPQRPLARGCLCLDVRYRCLPGGLRYALSGKDSLVTDIFKVALVCMAYVRGSKAGQIQARKPHSRLHYRHGPYIRFSLGFPNAASTAGFDPCGRCAPTGADITTGAPNNYTSAPVKGQKQDRQLSPLRLLPPFILAACRFTGAPLQRGAGESNPRLRLSNFPQARGKRHSEWAECCPK